MLRRLEIHDFALIEQMVLEPAAGLTVISGETGAGKSMLVDAINCLAGQRASREMIRTGRSRARIEAVFDLPKELMSDPDWSDILADSDADADLAEAAAQVIVARELSSSGKSVSRINGRLVTQQLLRSLMAHLVEIHGQHEQQQIFAPSTQRRLLDRYGGAPVEEALQLWQQGLVTRQDILSEMQQLGQDPTERARRLDLLQYQLAEIERVAPEADELAKTEHRYRQLSALQRINEGVDETLSLLDGEARQGIPQTLGQAAAALDFAARHSSQAVDMRRQLLLMSEQASDLFRELSVFQERIAAEPGELEKISNRLAELQNLFHKYGPDQASLTAFQSSAEAELTRLQQGGQRFQILQEQLAEVDRLLAGRARVLHERRAAAAGRLSAEICRELQDLAMKDADFCTQVVLPPDAQSQYPFGGRDQISMLISVNPGEPLLPLSRIASGGEAARVMLAIKSILAAADDVPVLIFDEIDTGISGRTAERVALKLRQIGAHRQVFCISHMAQIAALAHHQLEIRKEVADNRTRTLLTPLTDEQRVAEVARLLTGKPTDPKSQTLARSMLNAGAAETVFTKKENEI